MALLVYYRKTRETPTEVEYLYGHQETSLRTQVVLSNSDSTGPPIAGTRDPICQQLVRRVRRQRAQTMLWPEAGVIQS